MPSDVSVLDITSALHQIKQSGLIQNAYDLDNPVGHLEPGPMVNINFLVTPELSEMRDQSTDAQRDPL